MGELSQEGNALKDILMEAYKQIYWKIILYYSKAFGDWKVITPRTLKQNGKKN